MQHGIAAAQLQLCQLFKQTGLDQALHDLGLIAGCDEAQPDRTRQGPYLLQQRGDGDLLYVLLARLSQSWQQTAQLVRGRAQAVHPAQIHDAQNRRRIAGPQSDLMQAGPGAVLDDLRQRPRRRRFGLHQHQPRRRGGSFAEIRDVFRLCADKDQTALLGGRRVGLWHHDPAHVEICYSGRFSRYALPGEGQRPPRRRAS